MDKPDKLRKRDQKASDKEQSFRQQNQERTIQWDADRELVKQKWAEVYDAMSGEEKAFHFGKEFYVRYYVPGCLIPRYLVKAKLEATHEHQRLRDQFFPIYKEVMKLTRGPAAIPLVLTEE